MVVYGLDGSFVGSGEGQFNNSWSVVVNGDAVLVVDFHNHRVQVFGLDGSFVRQWGGNGVGAGQFDHPSGIACSGRGRGVFDKLLRSDSGVQVTNQTAQPKLQQNYNLLSISLPYLELQISLL